MLVRRRHIRIEVEQKTVTIVATEVTGGIATLPVESAEQTDAMHRASSDPELSSPPIRLVSAQDSQENPDDPNHKFTEHNRSME